MFRKTLFDSTLCTNGDAVFCAECDLHVRALREKAVISRSNKEIGFSCKDNPTSAILSQGRFGFSRRQKKNATFQLRSWWGKVDSNHRRHSQQIYSLSPLATREFPHMQFAFCAGAGRRTRTPDLLITNQLLYRLSYTSTATKHRDYIVLKSKSQGFFSGKDETCKTNPARTLRL